MYLFIDESFQFSTLNCVTINHLSCLEENSIKTLEDAQGYQ